jgi:hypothetical protein
MLRATAFVDFVHLFLSSGEGKGTSTLLGPLERASLNHCSSGLRETTNKQTPWSESARELYRPSDRRLSAKWLPTFADRGCHVVSVTDPYGRILGFLDRSHYFSIK